MYVVWGWKIPQQFWKRQVEENFRYVCLPQSYSNLSSLIFTLNQFYLKEIEGNHSDLGQEKFS